MRHKNSVLQQSLYFHTEERNGQTSDNEAGEKCQCRLGISWVEVNTMLKDPHFFHIHAEKKGITSSNFSIYTGASQ